MHRVGRFNYVLPQTNLQKPKRTSIKTSPFSLRDLRFFATIGVYILLAEEI